MFCVHKVLSRQLVQYEFGVNYCMFLELFLTFHCQGLEARLVLVCQRRFAKRLQATVTWMTGKNRKECDTEMYHKRSKTISVPK